MEDAKFIEQVRKEMLEIKANHTINDQGDQFAVWFGKMILGFDEDKVAEEYHIGSAGDDKIDLGIVSSESETKLVAQCKYSANPDKARYNKDLVDEVLAARRRITDSPTTGNEKRKEFVKLFSASSKPQRLIAVGFGGLTRGTTDYAATQDVEVYDFQRLKREYLLMLNPARVRPPQSVTLSVPGNRIFEYREGAARAYIVSLPAGELHSILSQERIGPGIFQDNLRYRLRRQKSSTTIATAIQNTVTESPENLLILNNGVTFTCHRIESGKDRPSGFKTFTLDRPQIVNGCQTAYAVYDAIEKQGSDAVSDAYVLAKIVVLSPGSETDVARITESTNSQNRITERDQFANNELQLEIKSAFQQHNPAIFYESKNGEWELTKEQRKAGKFRQRGETYRRIDNETSARVYLALMGLPAAAKNLTQSTLFTDEKYRNAIFDYRLQAPSRFPEIGADDHKLNTGLDNFIADIVFGYAVKRLSESVVLLYKRKLALYDEDTQRNELDQIKGKEFLRYWHSHVIRLMHLVIEYKVRGDAARREELRRALIGQNVGNAFDALSRVADALPFDDDTMRHTVLVSNELAHPFGLFASWFERLSMLAMDLAQEAQRGTDSYSHINYFAKRRETGAELTQKVRRILGGPDSDRDFPSPPTSKTPARRATKKRARSTRAAVRR